MVYCCEDITPLALQKALYYVQGFFCAFTGELMFPEDCEAWVHGPVYRKVYSQYRNYRYEPIAKNPDFEVSVFTEEQKAVIECIIRHFCCYSGKCKDVLVTIQLEPAQELLHGNR